MAKQQQQLSNTDSDPRAASASDSAGEMNMTFCCNAFHSSLSPDPNIHKDAEVTLRQLSCSPGLLNILAQIITANTSAVPGEVACIPAASVSIGVKIAASVYLKNEIRKFWEPRTLDCSPDDVENRKVYSEQDKAEFRSLLIDLTKAVVAEGTPAAVTNSIDESIRSIVRCDFPEKWPHIFTAVIELLKHRSSVDSIKAGLLILRRLVKKYEYRPSQDQEVVNQMVTVAFPLLLSLASDLLANPIQTFAAAAESPSSMLKCICKIYWSSTQMVLASGEILEASLDAWMNVMRKIIEVEVPLVVSSSSMEPPSSSSSSSAFDLNVRSKLPQYKTKKWALQVVHRLLVRYGCYPVLRPNAKEAGGRRLGEFFIQNWSGIFMDSIIATLKAEKANNIWMSDDVKNFSIQYLTQLLELSVTYKAMKPHIEFVLYEVCFPLLCYSIDDVEKWQSDPSEFIRSQAVVLCGGPRDCAIEFIQTLVRLRARDHFESIVSFVQNIMVNHQLASPELQRSSFNRQKDGALFMIGAIANRLSSKKRQIHTEPFLVQYVLPELTNQNDAFLRLRACWTYQQFLDNHNNENLSFSQPQQIIEAFLKIVDLCLDCELPIRVAAATALGPFFEVEQKEIRNFVEGQIPQLMERLLNIMAQVPDSENIVSTLDSLVVKFDSCIPPYGPQLINYLSAALLRMICMAEESEDGSVTSAAAGATVDSPSPCSVLSGTSGGDGEDLVITAMTVASAILSVLSTLTTPNFQPMFDQIAANMGDLLNTLMTPACLDYFQDSLAMLTFLTRYCSNLSSPTDLWRYYERCYQAICGGNSSHLTLDGESIHGWAPDYLDKMLPPLENLISRDSQRFITGISSIQGKYFKTLFIEIVNKCMITLVDPECPKYALEFMMLLFEGYIGKAPAIDDMLRACFDILIGFERSVLHKRAEVGLRKPNVAMELRLLSTMILYNPTLLLELVDSSKTLDVILGIFSYIEFVKSYEGKRVFVLAFAQLVDLYSMGKLLIAMHGQVADMIKAIERQLKSSIEIRKTDEADEDDYESDSEDSEQDIGEHEDAGTQAQRSLAAVIEKAVAEEEEKGDDDDDDDYYEDEAETDDLRSRESPMDALDELNIISSLIHKMEPTFASVLGVDNLLSFKRTIESEVERRHKQTLDAAADETAAAAAGREESSSAVAAVAAVAAAGR